MKPQKNTIKWLAPHLSDGEVKAIYEAMLGVIGDDPEFPPEFEGDTSVFSEKLMNHYIEQSQFDYRAAGAIKHTKIEQRKELRKLFNVDM